MSNITISGNSAEFGGGIENEKNGTATLTNVTITGNTAVFGGGGVYQDKSDAGKTITLKNTIVANSTNSIPTNSDCFQESGGAVDIVSAGFNLADDDACRSFFNKPSDQNAQPGQKINVLLGPLANNGGTTKTHLPQAGSPAIDHGTNTDCPATDQRHLPRPAGLSCDVGAVEVQGSAPTSTPTRTPTSTPTRTATRTLTPGAGTLGGHGFSLEVTPNEAIHAHWTDGTIETGYRALQINVLTGGIGDLGILNANASGFDDSAPPAIACYLALVLGGNPVNSITLGQTDGLCVFMNVAAGNIPPHFKIQLNEGLTSTLTWATPPGGAPNGYTLVVIPVDGSSPVDFQQVAAGVTTKTHNTNGKITCYQLLVNGPGDNKTNAVCAFPGASALAAETPASPGAAANRLRQTFNLHALSEPRPFASPQAR
jgi:hypothetical protein